MTFNIQEFKAKMNQYGGPALTNLFVVEFFASNSNFVPNADLRFFCKTATLPSLTFDTTDYKPNTIGISQSMPTGIGSDPVECIFMLDSNHQILSFFHEWGQNIVNYDTSSGLFAPNARDQDQLPYEVGYKRGPSGYSMRMTIKYFSSFDPNSYYECILENAYPKTIGGINLSWEDNNTPATLPVSFSYDSFKMDATRAGPIENDRSRGFGYLDEFASLGGRGQAINSLNNSLQNIVDRTTRVRDAFSVLNSLLD